MLGVKNTQYGSGWRLASLLALSALVATFLVVGTAVGQTDTAPDCGTVSYDGEGTETEPYEVSGVAGLACMGNTSTPANLNDSFVLVSDVDATVTRSWNDGRGFKPIGRCLVLGDSNCTAVPFGGSFDGNSHTVTGLYIDRPNENLTGTFGAVGSGGSVVNLTLKDVDVTGGDFNRVGGLVGLSLGTVDGARVTGEVTGENFNAGGVVGANDGEVTRSYADVDVEGVAAVGGLVGNTDPNSTVTMSYATGDVTAERRAGGLVGRNIGLVSDSYATGNVTATDEQAGGLTGSNQRNGTVTNSLAVASVGGGSSTGGITGRLGAGEGEIGEEFAQDENETSSLVGVYWDTETTGQTNAVGERAPGEGNVIVEGTVGLTTDEIGGSAASETMPSLNFTDTWTITDGYPVLAWQVDAAEDSGDDSETNEIESNGTASDENGEGDTDNTTDDTTGQETNEDEEGVDGGESNDGTDSGDGEGLPGFGVAAALIAVSLVIARRLG